MPTPLPPRMTELVSKDYETQRVQRNAADAVNSVLANLQSPLGFSFPGPLSVAGIINGAAGLRAQSCVAAQPASVLPALNGGAGNSGSYAALVTDATTACLELHGNSGVPYVDFATTPTADFDYRIAQDPANVNRRLYITSLLGTSELLIATTTLTLSAALSNTGPSSFQATIGPFYIGPNLAFAAGATAAGGIANGFNSALYPYLAPRQGSILGVSAYINTSSGTSNFIVRPVLNGAATAAGVAVTAGTTATPCRAIVARGTVPFNAGDNIRCDFTSIAATNVSSVAYVHVEFTP